MPTMPPRHRPAGVPTREEAEKRRKAIIDQRRPSSTERGYDAAWRAVRKQFIAAHPICSACPAPATDADHVQSIAERPDLRLKWSNLRPYCHAHHSERTARDQGFARRA
jgi:5-methylcytosine-specific restriction protein A